MYTQYVLLPPASLRAPAATAGAPGARGAAGATSGRPVSRTVHNVHTYMHIVSLSLCISIYLSIDLTLSMYIYIYTYIHTYMASLYRLRVSGLPRVASSYCGRLMHCAPSSHDCNSSRATGQCRHAVSMQQLKHQWWPSASLPRRTARSGASERGQPARTYSRFDSCFKSFPHWERDPPLRTRRIIIIIPQILAKTRRRPSHRDVNRLLRREHRVWKPTRSDLEVGKASGKQATGPVGGEAGEAGEADIYIYIYIYIYTYTHTQYTLQPGGFAPLIAAGDGALSRQRSKKRWRPLFSQPRLSCTPPCAKENFCFLLALSL